MNEPADGGSDGIEDPTARANAGSPVGPTESATVLKSLPNRMLRVVTETGEQVDVHASGVMRVRVVRLLPGDRVRIQRSPFDPTKGRLTELAQGH